MEIGTHNDVDEVGNGLEHTIEEATKKIVGVIEGTKKTYIFSNHITNKSKFY